jgi:HEAT repeat protein
MAAMRRLPTLLLLAATAAADDAVPSRLADLEAARKITLDPGAESRVHAAVDALVATRDVRAVAPLSAYLAHTIAEERRLFEAVHALQVALATAFDRVEVLDGELKQLALKEKAGDASVGPAIAQREEERRNRQREVEQREQQLGRAGKNVEYLRDLRRRLRDGCVEVLKGLEGESADQGVAGVLISLRATDREQALHLVHILGACGLPQAELPLLDLLGHSDEAVRNSALFSLASRGSRRSAEALVELWQRDPERSGTTVSHALSMAAGRRLATVEEARAWAASLP